VNATPTVDKEMTVDEIMRRWPATIRVFIRHRMLCIGCPIGVFHTVGDACDAHQADEESFSRELLAAMRGGDATGGRSAFETAGATAGVIGGDEAARPPDVGGSIRRATSCDGSPPPA
jgi:hybrid cluster-associated redox disulfide protein